MPPAPMPMHTRIYSTCTGLCVGGGVGTLRLGAASRRSLVTLVADLTTRPAKPRQQSSITPFRGATQVPSFPLSPLTALQASAWPRSTPLNQPASPHHSSSQPSQGGPYHHRSCPYRLSRHPLHLSGATHHHTPR